MPTSESPEARAPADRPPLPRSISAALILALGLAIVFAAGYSSHGTWWKIGLVLSVVNLTVWAAFGLGWWKMLGLW